MFYLCSQIDRGRVDVGSDEKPVVVDATDDEIDAVIAEFGGDYRQAIRALLHDLSLMAMDSEAAARRVSSAAISGV